LEYNDPLCKPQLFLELAYNKTFALPGSVQNIPDSISGFEALVNLNGQVGQAVPESHFWKLI